MVPPGTPVTGPSNAMSPAPTTNPATEARATCRERPAASRNAAGTSPTVNTHTATIRYRRAEIGPTGVVAVLAGHSIRDANDERCVAGVIRIWPRAPAHEASAA